MVAEVDLNIFFEGFLTFLFLAPFPFIIWMIQVQGIHQKDVMFFFSAYAACLAVVIWRVELVQIAGCFAKGLWMSYELVLVACLGFMLQQPFRQSRASAVIREIFAKISPDPRIQIILVAWLFGSAIEGILGFGATGGFCAVMLGGLGFPPMCAIMMGLMGPVTAGAFNAVGSPILYGVRHSMENPVFLNQLAMSGHTMEGYLRLVSAQTAVFNGIMGIFMPLAMVLTATKLFGKNRSWMDGWKAAPFALFSGLAFVVPYVWTAIVLGPEFPAWIGSIVGTVVVLAAIKLKFLLPSDTFEFPAQRDWQHNWAPSKTKFKPEGKPSMPLWLAIFPFAGLAVLELITRLPPVGRFLSNVTVEWHNIWGSTVSIVAQPFYIPTSWMVAVMVVVATLAFKLNMSQIRAYSMPTIIPSSSMLLKAPFAVVMITIFAFTGMSHSGMPGMFRVVADFTNHLPLAHIWYPFLVPFQAALATTWGTNNTFSNLLNVPLQFSFEQSFGTPPGFLVALQAAGATGGNMLALRYITSTVTFMGMLAWEGPVGRRMMVPVILYSTLLGALGVLFSLFFNLSAYLAPWVGQMTGF